MAEEVWEFEPVAPKAAPAPTPRPEAPVAAPTAPERTWSQVGEEALQNLGSSAKGLAEAYAYPIMHPIDTATGVAGLATGYASKGYDALANASGWFDPMDPATKPERERYADAMNSAMAERYGGLEQFKNTLATDPLGAAADIGGVLTLGGGLAARAPGLVGKTGKVLSRVGEAVDPVTYAPKAVGAAGRGVDVALKNLDLPPIAGPAVQAAKGVGSKVASVAAAPVSFLQKVFTGQPFSTYQEAFRAGFDKDPAFWAGLNGKVNPADVADRVTKALESAKKAKREQYLAGMDPIVANQTQIPLHRVNGALYDAMKEFVSPVGPIRNDESMAFVAQMQNLIDQYRNDTNPVARTAYGFDDLKQAVDLAGRTSKAPYAQEIASKLRNAIKDEIMSVDPAYGKVMEDYQNALQEISTIRELVKSGKGGNIRVAPTIKATLRALDDPMQKDIVQNLVKYDPELPGLMAGMSLSDWVGRGAKSHLSQLGTVGSTLVGAAQQFGPMVAMTHPMAIAGVLGSAAATSPRVQGTLAYGAGRAMAAPLEMVKSARARAPAYLAGQAGTEGVYETEPREPSGEYWDLDEPITRATGGRVSAVNALMKHAELAKKRLAGQTESILSTPDETVAMALAKANEHL